MATGQVGFIYTRQDRVDTNGKVRVGYRRDPFFTDRGASLLSASVTADAGPWLRDLADMLPKEAYKALSALGYAMQKGIRADIVRGGPDGTSWPKLSPITRSGVFDELLGRPRPRRRGRFFGQLYGPIGYFRYPLPQMRVDVGWLSASAQRLGYMVQRGVTPRVTDKSRRLYAVAKRKIPSSITVPARPLMREAYESRRDELIELFQTKVARYVERGAEWMHETRSNAAKRASGGNA